MDFKIGASRPAPPPLPSFSFNQVPRSDFEPTNGSPQLSPTSPRFSLPLPSRPHRRGHSEFIGVDANSGPGQLLGTSLNSDSPLPPPGPSKGRRGHAHRRSAAISCGDLTFIIKPAQPPPKPAAGSAPSSPADDKPKPAFTFPDTTTVSPVPEVVTPPLEEPSAPTTPPKPQRAARVVGFSDTLEFIPRPLSLVSSDASSTMTVRQGHSVTNSMSSVISVSASSPPAEKHRGLAPATRSTNAGEDRPSTAGPILGATRYVPPLRGQDEETRRRNSDPATTEEASTAAKIAANGSQEYTLLSDDYNMSPENSRPSSPSSFDRAQIAANFMAPVPGISHVDTSMSGIEELPKLARKTSSTRKVKKQKKVKYWAGSILSRKNKSRKVKASKRAPTPPMQSFEEEVFESPVSSPITSPVAKKVVDNSTAPEIDLDAALAETPLTKSQAAFLNWKPRHINSQDEDSSSPIIDLDAALGPFNTPTHDSDWAAAQKAGSPATRRKMHSAAGMRNFTGPGLHYHRRTESAPEMVAFESPRFGNSSAMEDVFEEDEEDDWEEVKTVSHKGSSVQNDEEEVTGLGIEIKVVDAENGQDKMDWTMDEQRGVKRKTSELSEQESQMPPVPSLTSARSQSSLKDTDTVKLEDFEPPPPFRDDCSIYRPVSSRSSTSSSIQTEKFPTIEQTYPGQPPFLTPTTPSSTFQSPFPSPRSRMSHETQRQSTAPSSIIEEPGFNPLWLGEPGPEIRMSVDDVPSLTSSNSTMTRDSMQNPALGNPQFRNGQRSASLSSGGLGPASRGKRSSIVSLSRLLSSSHGEKSKLSIEERAPELDEKKKPRKGKRISRMMQFWKPSKE